MSFKDNLFNNTSSFFSLVFILFFNTFSDPISESSVSFVSDFDFISDLNLEEIKMEIDIKDITFDYNNEKNNEKEITDENLNIENQCPKCGYEW